MERPKLETLFLAYRTSGDATALAQVFDLAAPELYELARRLSPDRSAAEDVLQDTFVTAIEKRASWDEREPLLPWLIGILAIASQRRRREQARKPDPQRVTQPEAERPEAELATSELRAELEATLSALSTDERSLVEQRLIEGRTPRQMARERGLSATTLRMRLSRALARLRRAAPSSLSWAFLPWSSRRALHSVRLRVLPNATPTLAPLTIGAAVLGIAAVAGALGMLAQREPEKPTLLAAAGDTVGPIQFKTSQVATEPGSPSDAKWTPTSLRRAVPRQVPVHTIEPPAAEDEFAAPAASPLASRKRLQLRVVREGLAIAGAEVLRLLPKVGYDGVCRTDSDGRVDVDFVLQETVQLCVRARACKNAYLEVEPAQLEEGEERTIALEPGPEPAFVTFRFAWKFPPGFVAQFVPIDLLNGQRPSLTELYEKFPKAAHHPECGLAGVDPEGFLSSPIVPGRYWVLARYQGHGCRQSPDLLPSCFELTIPEVQFFECEYPGSVGGSIILDVLGPAASGPDVAVSLDDGTEVPPKLWFQTHCDSNGSSESNEIHIGTLRARSEPIPAGEQELVFTQRGKEIDRRRVQIVRGEELKLSISP